MTNTAKLYGITYIPPAMDKIWTARNELVSEIVTITNLLNQSKLTVLSVENNVVSQIVNNASNTWLINAGHIVENTVEFSVTMTNPAATQQTVFKR